MACHLLLRMINLKLPKNCVPKDNDGEITNFYLLPIEKILKIIKNTKKFKFDCALVILLFAQKKRIINLKKKLLSNNSDLKILKKIK